MLAKRRCCQICGVEYGRIFTRYRAAPARPWVPRENIDHILPVRWLRAHSLGDPHANENLLSTCHKCNLAKKGAEDRLFVGDVMGFVQQLRRRGWGNELRQAAKFYGLLDMAGLIST